MDRFQHDLLQFFFFNIYLFIYLAALGLSCSTRDLRCSMWCAGFSLVVARGLSCPVACGTRDRTCVPCIGRQILNH